MIDYMELARQEAERGMTAGDGGPFGACIVKDQQVVAVAHNEVLRANDPTAHAEMQAIRRAAQALGTYDLSGCTIYATGYPCPMCLAAILWSNIDTCYFANTLLEAEEIGFRDDFIYRHLQGQEEALTLQHLPNERCSALYEQYRKHAGTIY